MQVSEIDQNHLLFGPLGRLQHRLIDIGRLVFLAVVLGAAHFRIVYLSLLFLHQGHLVFVHGPAELLQRLFAMAFSWGLFQLGEGMRIDAELLIAQDLLGVIAGVG